MHPAEVTQEVRRNVKITLSPKVKFSEIEASAGELAFDHTYAELQPVVTAAGLQSDLPTWDYEPAAGRALRGNKVMHLLIKAPKGMESGSATLALAADVSVRRRIRLPLGMFRRSDEEGAHPLTIRLWGRTQ
jgi:hypothetical protein